MVWGLRGSRRTASYPVPQLCLLMLSMFLVRNLDPDYEKLLRGF